MIYDSKRYCVAIIISICEVFSQFFSDLFVRLKSLSSLEIMTDFTVFKFYIFFNIYAVVCEAKLY